MSRRLKTANCSTGPGNDRGLFQSGSRPGQPGRRDSPPWTMTCSQYLVSTSHFSLLTSQAPARSSQLASRTHVSRSVFQPRVPSPDERTSERAGRILGRRRRPHSALCSSSTVSTTYEARRMLVRRNGTLATPPRAVCPDPSVPASASSQCLARLAAHAKLMAVDPRRGPTCRSGARGWWTIRPQDSGLRTSDSSPGRPPRRRSSCAARICRSCRPSNCARLEARAHPSLRRPAETSTHARHDVGLEPLRTPDPAAQAGSKKQGEGRQGPPTPHASHSR